MNEAFTPILLSTLSLSTSQCIFECVSLKRDGFVTFFHLFVGGFAPASPTKSRCALMSLKLSIKYIYGDIVSLFMAVSIIFAVRRRNETSLPDRLSDLSHLSASYFDCPSSSANCFFAILTFSELS